MDWRLSKKETKEKGRKQKDVLPTHRVYTVPRYAIIPKLTN